MPNLSTLRTLYDYEWILNVSGQKGPFNQGKWVLLQRNTLNYASQEEETSYISQLHHLRHYDVTTVIDFSLTCSHRQLFQSEFSSKLRQ